MESAQLKKEIQTLKMFFEFYCKCKHTNQNQIRRTQLYKKEEISIDLNLCKECREKIDYSINRLFECPHEDKPSCRKCENRCYDKTNWKETARVMRFSSIKLGLGSFNKKMKSLLR